jgi:hypothetical protein
MTHNRREPVVRPAYGIALLVALVMAFWATGRADPVLARWDLNKGTCYQAFTDSSYYCGDDAGRLEYITGSGERHSRPGIINDN